MHSSASPAASVGGHRSDDPRIFDQEIQIKPIRTPTAFYSIPTAKSRTGAMGEPASFSRESRRRIQSPVAGRADDRLFLGPPDYGADWIFDTDVLVAEYWRVETKRKKRYQLEDGQVVFEPRGRAVERERWVEKRCVMQYITNGYEILERSAAPEPGTIIPIIPMIGMQRYVDRGGFSKRVLFSLVRLARDPQLSLAYLNSQEMEEAGLTPRAPSWATRASSTRTAPCGRTSRKSRTPFWKPISPTTGRWASSSATAARSIHAEFRRL